MQLARFHIIFTFLMLLLALCFHLAYRLTHVLPALSMHASAQAAPNCLASPHRTFFNLIPNIRYLQQC
jgi:hypothetical protein